MKEIDRRSFLKFSVVVGIGAVSSVPLWSVKVAANRGVEKLTGGISTGNARINHEIVQSCEESKDKENCVENFEFSTSEKILYTSFNPVFEEITFRASPSFILNMIEHRPNQLEGVIGGTWDGIGLTRRELLIGFASTFIFGLSHNVTSDGFDTETIPASPLVGGGVYWYLQRKFGLVSNTVCHALINLKGVIGR